MTMKKLLCLLICALLLLGACALAEGGQLPLAASLEAAANYMLTLEQMTGQLDAMGVARKAAEE